MKRVFKSLLLLIPAVLTCLCSMGQEMAAQPNRKQIDSLETILKTSAQDSSTFNVLTGIFDLFDDNKNADSALFYAKEMYALGVKLKNYRYQLKSLSYCAFIYRSMNFNYQKAAEIQFEALKLAEARNDSAGQAWIWEAVGAIYDDLDDPDQSIYYARKAYILNKKINNTISALRCAEGIGYVYAMLNMPDSALPYFQEANRIGDNNPDDKGCVIYTLSLYGLGKTNYESGRLAIAMDYYKKSLAFSKKMRNPWYSEINSIGLGELFKAKGNKDSSIYYYQKALDNGSEPKLVPGIYRNLAELYQDKNEHLSLKYWKLEALVRDSLYTSKKKREVQNMTFNEMERQNSIVANQIREEEQKAAALKLQKQRGLTYAGLAGVVMLLVFAFFITRNNKLLSKEKQLLGREKQLSEDLRQRSDTLLLNILPVEVANELKERGTTTAKHFDNVTVLFTDFVDFTVAGERMKPQELIDELHTCFKAFDEITGKYNIEKIKTIGDAYLAVCGLPATDPLHAEHAVRAAIEIKKFMLARRAQIGEKSFEVRIGIHSGSVVAGIVGVKKFAYDIWGDTVNTAARMEQNSEGGKINISHTTYELVKDKFACEYRGEIEAKGKGMLKMYYIV